jgi:hypothetical protein
MCDWGHSRGQVLAATTDSELLGQTDLCTHSKFRINSHSSGIECVLLDAGSTVSGGQKLSKAIVACAAPEIEMGDQL